MGELDGSIADYFPDVPADQLVSFRSRAPGVYGERGGWQLYVRAWLVKHPAALVLVDTGVGPVGAPGPGWFGTRGLLPDVLRETGTPPEAIDVVVLTHVHDDHIGGTIAFDDGHPVPAFPRASYLVQRADREWQAELAHESEEDRVIDSLLLQPLEAAGRLTVIDGDHRIADGVELHLAPGHTPGHQIVRVRAQETQAVITADAFNHPIQIPHPEWTSGTDATPSEAVATRRAMVAELLSDPGTTVAPTHFAEDFGEVRTDANGEPGWHPV